MITIDTNILIGLTANEAVMKEFPFIASMGASSTGGCCGQPVTTSTGNSNTVKMQLAFLSPSGQQRFKQLTGWNQVRVVFESGAGTQTVIF